MATAWCLTLLGLVSVSIALVIEPGKPYYIFDEAANALTLEESESGVILSATPLNASLEQKWIFLYSGDKFAKIEDNFWVIRPADRNETKTLDVSKSDDGWIKWLLDWNNSRVWRLQRIDSNKAQIQNNRYAFCLRNEVKSSTLPVGPCDLEENGALTPETLWTIELVGNQTAENLSPLEVAAAATNAAVGTAATMLGSAAANAASALDSAATNLFGSSDASETTPAPPEAAVQSENCLHANLTKCIA